jgi:hypothetical protein
MMDRAERAKIERALIRCRKLMVNKSRNTALDRAAIQTLVCAFEGMDFMLRWEKALGEKHDG